MRTRFAVIVALTALLASCGDDDAVSTGLVWGRVDDDAAFGGPGGQGVSSVAVGGPGLVAAGYEFWTDDDGSLRDGDAAVWVSADGYSWTRIPHDEAVFGGPGHQGILSVAAGGPGLVAGGYSGGDAAVWVTADGYSWTRIPHDETVFGGSGGLVINSVAAGGPGLVAAGYESWMIGFSSESSAVVWVSADGYTWTRVPLDEAASGELSVQGINSVAGGGPGLVAVGYDRWGGHIVLHCGHSSAAVWVTADGYTWTRIEDGAVFGGSGDWGINSVVAGGPGLVGVGYASTNEDGCGDSSAAVWVSADGYTWTRIPHDEAVFGGSGGQQILSVAAGGPGLVAAGSDGPDAAVWVSADGYTWARIPLDEAVFGGSGGLVILSVAAGGPGVVAGGYDESGDDSDAAVWVADPSSR